MSTPGIPGDDLGPGAALVDSRRLTGVSLMLDGPGAILEARLAGLEARDFAAAWESALDRMLGALDWAGAHRAWRRFPGGASFAFEAPIDALYAATEVNEWAFAEAARATGALDETAAFAVEAARLRAALLDERKPAWLAWQAEAAGRNLTFLWDDKRLSLGLGTGSVSVPADAPPPLERLPWSHLHDVPVAMVTGTNGKTTTVRLLAAIARAAGKLAGVTSTDRVDVGDETVATGDYSGPNGARTVLRDRRVELGVLEVARGGILRRGLSVPHVEVAVITNVANDHLGEYGVHDLDTLADAKMVVTRAVRSGGRAVLNADDPRLLERGGQRNGDTLWTSLAASHPTVRAHVAAGGDAAWLEDTCLMLARDGTTSKLASIDELPIAFGGAARYNVANALAAAGAAAALGLPLEAIRAGLRSFASTPEANPGRANLWRFGTLTAIVDYAHNPHGLAALAEMAAAVPATRRAIVLGQAGDRDDASIRELARAAASMQPDRVFLKEMERFRRGREPGVVLEILASEFRACGLPAAAIESHESETAAVDAAIAWAREGDLLLLTTHAERDQVFERLRELERTGWRPPGAAA
ncbi:MAG: Mur ligase [Candidatus Eisenbacteria bacterium]|uniref:Mur ligase n=1 Tax=Eiseniibacteriota bacterium TaxID=2212470 RepID=A0A849SGJ5_UNCEI|nr:Mur ligase [Candidatus Eisenbacteria bacterium]